LINIDTAQHSASSSSSRDVTFDRITRPSSSPTAAQSQLQTDRQTDGQAHGDADRRINVRVEAVWMN